MQVLFELKFQPKFKEFLEKIESKHTCSGHRFEELLVSPLKRVSKRVYYHYYWATLTVLLIIGTRPVPCSSLCFREHVRWCTCTKGERECGGGGVTERERERETLIRRQQEMDVPLHIHVSMYTLSKHVHTHTHSLCTRCLLPNDTWHVSV